MKIRYCSAALAYNASTKEMLIISNKKRTAWTFPKGGLEPGISAEENAAKECLEESGYSCAEKGFSLGTYEIYKEGMVNRIEVFALALGRKEGDPEPGRKIVIGSPDLCCQYLDRYLQPFVMRLEEHLEACNDHDSRKKK